MIEPMKKTVVVCLSRERDGTVAALRDLGILHVVDTVPPASPELETLQRQHADLERAARLLASRRPAPGTPPEPLAATATETAAVILELDDSSEHLEERRRHWQRLREQAAPWGGFRRQDLEELQNRGLQIVLATASQEEFARLRLPDAAVLREISRPAGLVHFAVVAPAGLALPVEPAVLPQETDLAVIDEHLAACNRETRRIEEEFDRLAVASPALAAALQETNALIEFAKVRDAAGGRTESLTWLQGFVPAKDIGALQAAASQHGWALLLADPAADEPVPTLLTVPRLFRQAQLILDFLGIVPEYREIDISVPLVIAMILFTAILVGDGGYGLLFLAASLTLRQRAGTARGRAAGGLFAAMSVTIIAWGTLTGTWFAIPRDRLPGFLQGADWMQNDANQQYAMFWIGIIHLTLAHLMRGWAGRQRAVSYLAHLGWILILWGNFVVAKNLVVYQTPIAPWVAWLYLPGLLLILPAVNWKDVTAIFNLPFTLIGTMVDLISYIRLFAVGMAGLYIADSINQIAQSLTALGPLGFGLAFLLVGGGHLLNMGLCVMSVMVHAIRLNVLEFANHSEISWTGLRYHPFRKAEG